MAINQPLFQTKDRRKLNHLQARVLKEAFNRQFAHFDEIDDELEHELIDHHDSEAPSHHHAISKSTDKSSSDGDQSSSPKTERKRSHHSHPHSDHSHDDHGHEHKDPSIFTALAAGVINFVLMFGFCCAYGMIIFSAYGHKKHVGLGIKMCLASSAMLGLTVSIKSKFNTAVGGPDMNAVIFIGDFVDKISKELAKQHHLTQDESGYGPDDKYFCDSENPYKHYDKYKAACDQYDEELRATTIFAATVSSGLIAIVFLLLGGLRLTRYITYMPSSIVDAFLSCMGYKVFKYGLKLCKHQPYFFIPAACVGVPLYFVKAMHLLKPVIAMLLFLGGPMVVFYGIVFAAGWNVEEARKNEWMFPKVKKEDFWVVWEAGLGSYRSINFKAWEKTLLDLLVMQVVCLLDCLVTALRVTEAKIPVKIDNCYETMLFGFGNLASAAASGAAGYMQLKLNLINFDILGNTEDRRGGILYALLCASFFFGRIELVNYLPRIFLGILLFFGGSGFVAEHLWGSKEYLSAIEWVQVVFILLLFMFTDEILYAVLAGFVLCGFTFIAKYAGIPCIAGAPMRGGELQSREQHSQMLTLSLAHIANSWLVVIRLKGYVFFASVQTVTNYLRHIIQDEIAGDVPQYRRVKFVLLDCELLDGLDSSAEKDIQQLTKETRHHGMRIIWSNVEDLDPHSLLARGTIDSRKDWFHSLDDALVYIERLSSCYRKRQQLQWEALHPAFALNQRLTRTREAFEPFGEILRLDVERFGIPWDYCEVIQVHALDSVLWMPGEFLHPLYLVHTGAVGLFHSLPGEGRGGGKVEKPLAIYRHGWFLNREFLMGAATHHYAVALEDGELLCWTMHEWWRMQREQPLMASAIMESAMRQAGIDMERMAKTMRMTHNGKEYEEAHCLERGARVLELEEDEVKVKRPPQETSSAKKLGVGANRQSAITPLMNLSKFYAANLRKKVRVRGRAPVQLMTSLPEALEARLEFIECTQALESHGFYDPIPPGELGVLPELPEAVRQDLQVSFFTYAKKDPVKLDTLIPFQKVSEALMFAGIYNTLLHDTGKKFSSLTESQFMALGHEALMIRMSKRQILKAWTVFNSNKDENDFVPSDEMVEILRNSYTPHISEQEVYGIITIFDTDNTGLLTLQQFVGILARYVRRHEQDWNTLRGMRDVMGKKSGSKCNSVDVLTQQKLFDYINSLPNQNVSVAYVEEMLWCAAACSRYVTGRNVGKKLDFGALVGAIVLCCDIPFGKLPPPPMWVEFLEESAQRGSYLPPQLAFTQSDGTPDTARSREEITSSPRSARPLSPRKPREESPRNGQPNSPRDSPRTAAAIRGANNKTKAIAAMATTGGEPSAAANAAKAQLLRSATNPNPKAPAASSPKNKAKPQKVFQAKKSQVAKSKSAKPKSQAEKLAALRLKFQEHTDGILDLCAEKAVLLVGLAAARTTMSDVVVDLRTIEASSTAPNQFIKVHLEEVSHGHGHHHKELKKDKLKKDIMEGPDATPDLKMFLFLEEPQSSKGAFTWAILMGITIALSVVSLVVKAWFFPDACAMTEVQEQVWKVLECLFTFIFMGELVLRFGVCTARGGSRLDFITSPLNCCDLVSCWPFLVELLLGEAQCSGEVQRSVVGLFRITKLMRLARVARIVKHANKDNIFGPVSAVLTIIWGIYVKTKNS